MSDGKAWVTGLGFQLTWLACAFGAAAGYNWPGLAAAALLIALHMGLSDNSERRAVAILCGGAAMTGAIAETALAGLGLIAHAAAWPLPEPIAPAWMIALWAAFASTGQLIGRLLGETSYLRHAVVGLIAGPVAYAAGATIGALELVQPVWSALLAIAAVWALALPAMMAWRQRILSTLRRS